MSMGVLSALLLGPKFLPLLPVGGEGIGIPEGLEPASSFRRFAGRSSLSLMP